MIGGNRRLLLLLSSRGIAVSGSTRSTGVPEGDVDGEEDDARREEVK
jgi:hypothetical protein